MLLFLLLIFPIASIWVISEDLIISQALLDLRDYFLFGILLFIPSFFFINIFTGFLNQTYTISNIYFYFLFADYFFYQIFCIFSCILRFRNVMCLGASEGINRYFLYMAGFYTAFTFYSAIHSNSGTDLYALFLKPVTLLCMAVYSSVFMSFRDAETGLIKHLFTFLLIVFPAFLAFVPFFFYIRIPLLSFAIILLMAAHGFYVLYKKRNM